MDSPCVSTFVWAKNLVHGRLPHLNNGVYIQLLPCSLSEAGIYQCSTLRLTGCFPISIALDIYLFCCSMSGSGRGQEPIQAKHYNLPSRSLLPRTTKGTWNTRDPVRSPIDKPATVRLVVGWVTTSEYLMLYVYYFLAFLDLIPHMR